MTVDPTTLDRAMAEILRQYKGGVEMHSGDKEDTVSRLSTGSYELDHATGGGIPMGRCSHFWGSYSAGKSLTSWMVAKSAQAKKLEVAYYNIEKQYDKEFVKSLGVDPKKLHVIEATAIEEVGTVLEALLGSVHVHIIDSLAGAVSVDELSHRLEEWQIGLAARAWGKVLRRTNDRMDRQENAVIMVNHARDNFRGGEGAPGGRFIEHQSSCTIHFKRGGWLFYDGHGVLSPDNKGGTTPSLSGDMEPDGYEIVARVEKSRVSRPNRTARMRYDYKDRNFDLMHELSKAAKHYGIVNETSSGRFELDDGTKMHGIKAMRNEIQQRPELQKLIADTMMAQA
jgi:RecA/RadA recombinase